MKTAIYIGGAAGVKKVGKELGIEQRKGTAVAEQPARASKIPGRSLDRSFPRFPTWLPPNPAVHRGRSRRADDVLSGYAIPCPLRQAAGSMPGSPNGSNYLDVLSLFAAAPSRGGYD